LELSAFAATCLMLGKGTFRYALVPFDQIIDRVKSGEFEAGLIIHEGQLTFEAAGLHLIEDVGATAKQKIYLRDWGHAGMLTGVVSFVMEQGADVRSLRMGVRSYAEMQKSGWAAHTNQHDALGDKSERLLNIRQQLIGFADG